MSLQKGKSLSIFLVGVVCKKKMMTHDVFNTELKILPLFLIDMNLQWVYTVHREDMYSQQLGERKLCVMSS